MIVAAFFRGPFDGKKLCLPCDPKDPWEQFVLPRWDDPLFIEHLYLLAGRLDKEYDYAYIYEDDWGALLQGD